MTYFVKSLIQGAIMTLESICQFTIGFNVELLLVKLQHKRFSQGMRGHWAVNYTSPQSFIILIHWLKNFGTFYWILIGCFMKLSVQKFQQLIVIYRRGNFVYHNMRSLYSKVNTLPNIILNQFRPWLCLLCDQISEDLYHKHKVNK